MLVEAFHYKTSIFVTYNFTKLIFFCTNYLWVFVSIVSFTTKSATVSDGMTGDIYTFLPLRRRKKWNRNHKPTTPFTITLLKTSSTSLFQVKSWESSYSEVLYKGDKGTIMWEFLSRKKRKLSGKKQGYGCRNG